MVISEVSLKKLEWNLEALISGIRWSAGDSDEASTWQQLSTLTSSTEERYHGNRRRDRKSSHSYPQLCL